MMKKRLLGVIVGLVALCGVGYGYMGGSSKSFVISPNEEGADVTMQIRKVVEEAAGYANVKITLEEGTYYLKPDMAMEKYVAITNHGNGSKRIAFNFVNHKSVKIEGRGAKLIFHGQMMPFLFENCDNVEVSGVTIDWDIPFTFLAEVVAVDPRGEWREVKPRTAKDGFSWVLQRGKILYPNIDGFNYQCLGSTLAFDAEVKRPILGAIDSHSEPTKVERLKNGNLKIYEKLRQMPPVGSLLSSKGDREHDRYAPAFDMKECRNIELKDITIHHALGMGFLFERSEDIVIKDSKIVLSEGSKRVISSTADATHFANCKGKILIEGCRFENMLDDGTNVHGTYVMVKEVVDPRTVRVEFKHFEQMGFKFADKGDEMWFIQYPSPERKAEAKVKSVNVINEQIMEVAFESDMPADLKVGDLLENKTWNPEFTMRKCTIQNHRARAIILKTPLKTVIEDNYLSSMMSGVLFRGEMFYWYESGGVQDVLIKGNTFHNAADCGTLHAAVYVTPKMNKTFDEAALYDRNIRIVDNVINGFNPRVVIADRVDGLVVEGNTIIRNEDEVAPFPNAPLFELINCQNTTIKNNTYEGKKPAQVLKADSRSKSSMTIENNKGLKF